MKPIVRALVLLVAGVGVGGGAAVATSRFVTPSAAAKPATPVVVETSFVTVDQMLAPLVLRDRRLTGYVRFDAGLEVAIDEAPGVTERLPLLRHAINMRSYRVPLAAGPDGMLPDIAELQRVVGAAAVDAFGRGAVRKVAITKAEPA